MNHRSYNPNARASVLADRRIEAAKGRLTLWRRLLTYGSLFHQFNKSLEMMFRIVRTGRGFGVVLDRNDRKRAMPHAFHAAVIEIDVRDFDFIRQRVGLHRE